ncbi:TetR/AcrR family transcriptional regulator [Actinomadura algeriensis]|uniref:AcrR family transcriptional regulator n=1 Tax=Actinomadura algeriensis TaxID=1679523 RepID=A0ABR9JSV8_9ACTN|nr:TetR/AcrR family transcriptional regulator [Actinomadura algeriensis]MBE1533659.1 AcrR family transcriptional regulator [Actinomadura algeriensis]
MTEMRARTDEEPAARARIRDAAVREFAEHGVNGATIRGIARAAGVSPGLVQHHFGSKEALRRACDEYAVEILKRTKLEGLRGGIADPAFTAAALDEVLPLQRYLARALVDGSPGAAELFDDALAVTREMLKGDTPGLSRPNTSDPHAYAAVITGLTFGLVVVHEHMSRALGADVLGAEGYARMGRAMLDILTDDLLDPDLVVQMRAALDRTIDETTGPRIPTSDAAARKADSDPPA